MTISTEHAQTYLAGLQTLLGQIDPQPLGRAIETLHVARLAKRTIFVMGNGGSASTASHMVCDLAKNTRHAGVPHLRVIGLADNMAILSAYANDEGYASVFQAQLANLLEPNDVVIGISTSGKSPNVLQAIRYANEAGAITIGLTGFNAGQLGDMVQIHLHVPSDSIEYVEDAHLMINHLLTQGVRQLVNSG